MKTRMEKYYNDDVVLKRTNKNRNLYDKMHESVPMSTEVVLQDNVDEIDLSKIKELVDKREEYRSFRKYQDIVKTDSTDEVDHDDYDIYDDIENKIYDINSILENARQNRKDVGEREQRRRLKDTQYNILTSLDLNKKETETTPDDNDDTMDTGFFTNRNELLSKKDLATVSNKNDADLFEDLKPKKDELENTILTKPVEMGEIKAGDKNISNEENSFYTNTLSFTQSDFDDFQNLQSTVKVNNTLIKILIIILVALILCVGGFIVINKFM